MYILSMQASLNILPRAVFLLVYYCVSSSAVSFPYPYPFLQLAAQFESCSTPPLILTPLLRPEHITRAQNLSRVSITTKKGFESHAGFFTVDRQLNSNLFFWYFPAFSKNAEAPVLLWLQGGPGGSSLFGLFTEIGPLTTEKKKIILRKTHWALNNHLIFIDNPVGSGFSFTDDESGYCNDQSCVAKNLYSALQQFFTLFPKLRRNRFYITGESYAGKYIPSLAIHILNSKQNPNQKINLKGMAIGNGFCDPINQLDYGNYLYQHGLIDKYQLEIFLDVQSQIECAIKAKAWEQANMLMDILMDGSMNSQRFSYFNNFTGFKNYYNILKSYDDISDFASILQKAKVRRSIHVGGLPFNSGEEVQKHLELDILKSVAQDIEKLLSHYKLLLYNGQLDIIVAYPMQENFIQNLMFDSTERYRTARREIWMVGHDIAGYWKKAGNLSELLIRNAGHMVPHDQPEWAYQMITQFLDGKL